MATVEDPRPPKADFPAATNSLRDTIKWLAAAFAATAGLVIGSSPLGGLGALDIGTGPWWLAVGLLLGGFLAICAALWRTIRILRPDVIYRSDLLGSPGQTAPQAEDPELGWVRKEIDRHACDLLPANAPSLKELASKLAGIESMLQKAGAIPDVEERKKQLAHGQALRQRYRNAVDKHLPFAQYLRLHQRLNRELPWLLGLGVLALVMLGAFAIVTHQKPSESADPPVVVNNLHAPPDPLSQPAPRPLPTLAPVLFDTGSAAVTSEGLAAIQAAREALQGHPGTILLVRAHTDTVASARINVPLATRRASAVVELLVAPGGVERGRIYVADLPEAALPRVTPDDQADPSNRSVLLRLSALQPP